MKDFNPFDAIYCINLKIRPDRKEKMKKEFKKLRIKNVIWFDAVYGKTLDLNTIPNTTISPYAKQNLTKNEIGCALSHIGIWKDIIKKGYRNALIFEDDIVPREDMFKRLKQTWNYLPKNWDVLYLGKMDYKYINKKIINKYFEYPGTPFGTHAYSVKKSSAIKLLNNCLPLEYPVDDAIANQTNKLKIVAFRKNIFDQELLDSNIRYERFFRLGKQKMPYVIISILLMAIIFYLIRKYWIR